MAKKSKKSFLDSLRGMILSNKRGRSKGRRALKSRARALGAKRDLLSPFAVSSLDVDAMLNPTTRRPAAIPSELRAGTVLLSQRLGIKCVLLESLVEVGRKKLRDICTHKLKSNQVIYLPMGTRILKDEVLHQGRSFVVGLRKGTLFLSPGDHPNGYLLEALDLPLRRELGSVRQFLSVTETTAQKYLQSLVDIPPSFALIKEDVLFDTSENNRGQVKKGTLVLSRNGAMTGLMLDEVQMPIKGPISGLDELFQLKATYQRFPIETLIQRATAAGGREIPIERGTFLFTPHGKVYFVWKEDVTADEQKLLSWSTASYINQPGILEVSLARSNHIGGPGQVITQDEINYLHDVFLQAGTTNILRETLLLDRNIFYKFNMEMPYAQSGKFRSYLGKGVSILNTYSKGTFSVELGGKGVEITDLDLQQVRQHLKIEGRMLIKIGTHLRIRDERYGDWVYRTTTNLFYPYETFARPYMEEFIPENIAFDHRAEKTSTLIGPHKHSDIGAEGEPLADLFALINNELQKKPTGRTVFVFDGTLFYWNKRLYRVNEELVFRPQATDKIHPQDFEALESEWKIHPLIEEAEDEDEVPVLLEEEDLEDLPYDTNSLR